MKQTTYRGNVLTYDDVLKAMERFDNEVRATYPEKYWKTYAIKHNDTLYPPKSIMRLVVGDVDSGGKRINFRFAELGFTVVSQLKGKTAIDGNLVDAVKVESASAPEHNLEKRKIFISHAWEDKIFVQRLEEAIKTKDVDLWVDHTGIRAGDNLPERISEALDWCSTLLLVWSNSARASRWVNLEWTNAVSLQKEIILCVLDDAKIPAILANLAYIDFRDMERGLAKLVDLLHEQSKVAVPQTIPLKLRVPFERAHQLLETVNHARFQAALHEHWKSDENGNIRPPSVLWLFCWAKTGMGSQHVAQEVRKIFDQIFEHSYQWLEARVTHEYAKAKRYTRQ